VIKSKVKEEVNSKIIVYASNVFFVKVGWIKTIGQNKKMEYLFVHRHSSPSF
jgi:hypothetical protein